MKKIVFAMMLPVLLVMIVAAVGSASAATSPLAAPPYQSGSGGSVTYTSDGKSCVRDTFLGVGGGGSEDLFYAFESTAANNAFVVRELPHPEVDQVAYVRPTGNLMVTLTRGSSEIRIWETATGREKSRLQRPDSIYTMVVSSGRPLLAAVDTKGQVWLWDLSRTPISSPRLIATTEEYWASIALSPDGQYLAIAETRSLKDEDSDFGVVRLINTGTGVERLLQGTIVSPTRYDSNGAIVSLPRIGYGHGGRIDTLEFSPDGQVLLTGSGMDGTVRMWRVTTGQHLRCYEIHNDTGYSLNFALSPNGRELVSEFGSQITLWNALTGQVVRRFGVPDSYKTLLDSGGGSGTSAIGFRPDGAAVLQSFENEVRIWNKQTGGLQGVIRRLPVSATYSPDSRHLALAYDKGVLVTVADHKVTLDAATATRYMEAGLEYGLQGDIKRMFAAFQEASRIDPFRSIHPARAFGLAARNAIFPWNSSQYGKLLAAIPTAPATLSLNASDWNSICWRGSLATATDMFIDYCDKAVAVASAGQLADFRDSRAIARMYGGDRTGAIADLTAFVEYYRSRDPAQARLRQSWIDALSKGTDPVDFMDLVDLWNQ